jgi:hypothetical protein
MQPYQLGTGYFSETYHSQFPAMNINQVREQLHLLIDEVDDLYVLNGLYRNLLADKRQREAYEKELAEKAGKKNGKR